MARPPPTVSSCRPLDYRAQCKNHILLTTRPPPTVSSCRPLDYRAQCKNHILLTTRPPPTVSSCRPLDYRAQCKNHILLTTRPPPTVSSYRPLDYRAQCKNHMLLTARLPHIGTCCSPMCITFCQMDVLEHRLRHRKDDETPPLSPDGSLLSHEDSALFREPTELEVMLSLSPVVLS